MHIEMCSNGVDCEAIWWRLSYEVFDVYSELFTWFFEDIDIVRVAVA
jgi:hypothetical protein